MASFLKKMGRQISGAASGLVDKVEAEAGKRILAKYPDINDVLELLKEMQETYDKTDEDKTDEDATDAAASGEPAGQDGSEGDGGDSKWRPLLLTLGVLYKLQRIRDSNHASWYNRDEIFVHDDEEEIRLLNTFGFYWHYFMKISQALRSIHNDEGDAATRKDSVSVTDALKAIPVCPVASEDAEGNLIVCEEIYANLEKTTGLPRADILFAHATDRYHVDDHCPDFAVVLLHKLKQVLVVICGTRMIPTPKMKDVFMDLHADAEPFLDGVAHRGFAVGAKNILGKIMPKLKETLELEEHSGYNVMVIGYSLGAGICQLAVMDMLAGEHKDSVPDGTEIRCVNFGSPPVFKSDAADENADSDNCDNIFSVVYNNDGLTSASAASVTKLFMQIRAVDRLQLRRRDMLQMMWKSVPSSEGGALNDDDDDADDDFAAKSGSRREITALIDDENWKAVAEAVDTVGETLGGELALLDHPARHVFIFKKCKQTGEVITRRLTDTECLTRHLRLRGAMFSHHMPWGYGALFKDYGDSEEGVHLEDLPVKAKNRLYPTL